MGAFWIAKDAVHVDNEESDQIVFVCVCVCGGGWGGGEAYMFIT